MCRIANDHEFINQVLGPIAKVDNFTKSLLEVNNTIQREGAAQPIIACINRADYMLDKYGPESLRMRQVEINAIASAMSAHSDRVKHLQEYISNKYDIKLPSEPEFELPVNKSLDLVAGGIIDAFDHYGQPSAYVLLINEEKSINFSDQHMIEVHVHRKRPDIRFKRRRFIDLPQTTRLGPNRELLLDDNQEIGLVYFRFGYDPSNYNFEKAWDLRLLLERSRAIKCPSINFHLSGAKKFQQVLDEPIKLERYLEYDEARKVGNKFCRFWALDSEDFSSTEASKIIKSNPEKLVLKPQREGGGHNIFGSDIGPFLESIHSHMDRSQYILMEYIDSPREKNLILLPNDVRDEHRLGSSDLLVSELGIFGSILADGSSPISNRSAGYLIRSKKFGVNEGGVASGYAGIGNIMLHNSSETNTFPATWYS